MVRQCLLRLAPIAALAAAACVHAQQPPRSVKADPADAQAPVPPPAYESAFATYRADADLRPIAWKDANDAVARIGGWRVYLREARQPEPAAAARPAPAPHTRPAEAAKPMVPGPDGQHKP